MKAALDWHFWVAAGVTFVLVVSTTDFPGSPYASWRLYAIAAIAVGVGLLSHACAEDAKAE